MKEENTQKGMFLDVRALIASLSDRGYDSVSDSLNDDNKLIIKLKKPKEPTITVCIKWRKSKGDKKMTNNKLLKLMADNSIDKDLIDEVRAYIDRNGEQYVNDTIGNFTEAYRGNYNTELEFAFEIVEDIYDIDRKLGELSVYFDYQTFARDIFADKYYSAKVGTKLAIFEHI